MENKSIKSHNGPMHVAVANYIREQILSGALSAGEGVSSEKQLCEKFGISRGPVRQAMDMLVTERLISRSPGRGTFVSEFSKNRQSNLNGKDVLDIGVFFDSDFDSQWTGFFAEIISSLNTAAEATYPRCNLAYQFCERSLGFFSEVIIKGGSDGYLFVPLGPEYCHFLKDNLPASSKPMISFFREIKPLKISQFYIDQRDGAAKATDYLIRCGHKKIGILLVAPIMTRSDSLDRMNGYQQAFRTHGLEFSEEMIAETSLTLGGIKQCIDDLVHKKATAILIGGQALINPALKVIDQKGLKIPDDISLISFDDDPNAVLHAPSLTVVNQPLKFAARLALDRLVAEINAVATEVISIPIRPELILRESCRAL